MQETDVESRLHRLRDELKNVYVASARIGQSEAHLLAGTIQRLRDEERDLVGRLMGRKEVDK